MSPRSGDLTSSLFPRGVMKDPHPSPSSLKTGKVGHKTRVRIVETDRRGG